MRSHALCSIFCALSCAAPSAWADVASEARFFDTLARRDYEAGRYEKALESFQLAFEIAPSYRLLYNTALCADLAGRADLAFSLYQEYLKSGDSDGARRSEAERRAQRLKAKLALVAVRSDPEGAAVYVDRRELGRYGVTPATFAVPEGEHRLLVEYPGYRSEVARVVAKTGSVVPLGVSLRTPFGSITIHVEPRSAKLQFVRDGAPIVPKLGHEGYLLPAGQYQIVATLPGYVPAEARVAVRENARTELDLGLVAHSRATGRLLVSADGIPAEVFLDGARVAVAPAALSEVAVGVHLVELRAHSQVWRRRVVIRKNHATYVGANLAKPVRRHGNQPRHAGRS